MKIFIWQTAYSDSLVIAYSETCEEALGMFPTYVAKDLGVPTKVIDCEKDVEPFVTYV